MASVLVFMDRRGEKLSEQSTRVLATGRRIATRLGATLYGLAAETDGDNDGWISETGEGGADKVILLSGSFAAEQVRAETLVEGLAAVVTSLRPRLVLLAESASGRQLAARLATQMGALLLSDVTVIEKGTAIHFVEWSSSRRKARSIVASEIELPVVATISTANVRQQRGEDDADVIFFKSPTSAQTPPDLLTRTSDLDRFDGADIVVGAGVGAAHCLPLVDELARALGAVRASTRSLWQAGLAEKNTVVDWELQRIAPRLYIICGASGSASHLSAVASGSKVVTLGRDPLSPAMRAACYGLLGELELTLPTLTQKADAVVGAGSKR